MGTKAKRSPPKSPEDLDASLETFIRTFRNESDRGAVLVASALLDEILETLLRGAMSNEPHIKKRCIDPLFGPEAALATFASKMKIARAFGILADWMYEDLEIIRKIRNEFAHSHSSADFSNPNVVRLIGSLKAVGFVSKVIDVSTDDTRSHESEVRFTFLLSASCLIYILERGAAAHWLREKIAEIENQLEAEGGE
jgi:mannitol operon repressor